MLFATSIKRILSVSPEDFRVELEYEDGFRGTAELGFLFSAPEDKPLIREILRGNLFGKCFVESGGLAWPNGYELCPDALRQWIERSREVA